MTRLRRAGSVPAAFAVLALGLVAACSGDDNGDDPAGQTDGSPTAQAPTDPPSEGGFEPADEQDEAIIAAVERFHGVLDDVVQGEADESELDTVMIPDGPGRQYWVDQLAAYAESGIVQQGDRDITVVDITHSADGVAIVDVCLDVSDIDMVDEAGDSVVEADRPDSALHHDIMHRAMGLDGQADWRPYEYIPTGDPCPSQE